MFSSFIYALFFFFFLYYLFPVFVFVIIAGWGILHVTLLESINSLTIIFMAYWCVALGKELDLEPTTLLCDDVTT